MDSTSYFASSSDESDSEDRLPSLAMRGMSLGSKHLLNMLQQRRDSTSSTVPTDSNRFLEHCNSLLSRANDAEEHPSLLQSSAETSRSSSVSSLSSDVLDDASVSSLFANASTVDNGRAWDEQFCFCDAHEVPSHPEEACLEAEIRNDTNYRNVRLSDCELPDWQMCSSENCQVDNRDDEQMDDFNDDFGKTMKNLANEATRNRTRSRNLEPGFRMQAVQASRTAIRSLSTVELRRRGLGPTIMPTVLHRRVSRNNCNGDNRNALLLRATPLHQQDTRHRSSDIQVKWHEMFTSTKTGVILAIYVGVSFIAFCWSLSAPL